jgi:hypothetical protein
MHKLQISDIKKDPELSFGSHLADDAIGSITNPHTTTTARGDPVACPTRPCVRSGGHRRHSIRSAQSPLLGLNMNMVAACVNTHFQNFSGMPFSLSHFAKMHENGISTNFLAVC